MGTCIGRKSLQKFVIKVHEKSVDHMYSGSPLGVVHFPQNKNAPPMIQGLNVMLDREQLRIIIVMKFLYFTI